MSKRIETIDMDEDDAGSGSGYASDQEGDDENPTVSESFSSYLDGMFDSDDDDNLSTASKEIMPPPRPAFTTSNNSDSNSASFAGRGYASSDNSFTTTCSPLTSSGSESPPSSDEERWELHYLNKKRKLLTKALYAMKREEVYDASMAGSLIVTKSAFDTPLWKEAKSMAEYKENVTHHSSIHQRSLLGNKRPRIDLSSVYHVKGDIHSEIFMPSLCTTEPKEKSDAPPPRPATPVSVTSEEDSVVESNTIDLTHAMVFTPVAQVLAQADATHTIVHANRAFSKFSGLDTTELVGKSLESIICKRNHGDDMTVDDFCDAKVTTSSGTHRKCQMKMLSVKDAPSHKKKPDTFASLSTATDSPAVTHYLVQVKSLVQIAEPEVPLQASVARRSTRRVSSNRLLETVG